MNQLRNFPKLASHRLLQLLDVVYAHSTALAVVGWLRLVRSALHICE